MSREFRDNADTKLAWWTKDGTQVLAPYGIDAWIMPAFIAWLQEGPPKKKWRITLEFTSKPRAVMCFGTEKIFNLDGSHVLLTDDDIEEVRE